MAQSLDAVPARQGKLGLAGTATKHAPARQGKLGIGGTATKHAQHTCCGTGVADGCTASLRDGSHLLVAIDCATTEQEHIIKAVPTEVAHLQGLHRLILYTTNKCLLSPGRMC